MVSINVCPHFPSAPMPLGSVPERLPDAVEDLVFPPNLGGVHHGFVSERVRFRNGGLGQVDENVSRLRFPESYRDHAVVALFPVPEPPPLHNPHPGVVFHQGPGDVAVEHGEFSAYFFRYVRGRPRKRHDSPAVQQSVADVLRPAVKPLGHGDGVLGFRQRRQFIGSGFRTPGGHVRGSAAAVVDAQPVHRFVNRLSFFFSIRRVSFTARPAHREFAFELVYAFEELGERVFAYHFLHNLIRLPVACT
mmetsp:Transcript_8831/g.29439  ORF Transcript_8831/g.29439 Transcript_8831/m.29439 type:complete len:248 (+) Transcript_8831:365-1108(+)